MAKKKEVEHIDISSLSEAEKQKRIMAAFDTLTEFSPMVSFLDNAMSNVDSFEDTGCYILNALVSGKLRGGFPEARMSLLAAESSTGKTYIALQTAAHAQRAGKQVVIFDSEFAIDNEFATNLGLDTSKIIYFPVKTVEQCKNAVYKFLSNVYDLGLMGQFFIIIDSLGAMISEMDYKRMEKNSDSKDMGSYAQSMKALIKACNNLAGQTQTTIICTNHVYDDPAAMFTKLVKPMPGGKAVRYLPTTLVQLSANAVKEGDKDRKIEEKAAAGSHGEVGMEVRGLTVKNRICKPLIQGNMFISFENGLSKYYGLMDLALELGALKNVAGRIRHPETDEFLGFSKDIQFDAEFWEGFIDNLQPYIDKAWLYKTEAERRNAMKEEMEMEKEVLNED
jgi:RecA/RadA recombinase